MSVTETPQPSIWQQGLDRLSDSELRYLTQAAISVLWEQTPDPSVQSPIQLPPAVLTAELKELFGDQYDLEKIMGDTAFSREVTLAVLTQIGVQQSLAQDIEAAYRARRDMMVVDAGVVLAGALLLAVAKLKRIKFDKSAGEVDFFEVRSGILDAVRRLLSG
jgi:hypothetical protein